MKPGSVEAEDSLALLWSEVAQAHFLSTLTVHEATAVLQERYALVRHLLEQDDMQRDSEDVAISCMIDHFHTLLEAEIH